MDEDSLLKTRLIGAHLPFRYLALAAWRFKSRLHKHYLNSEVCVVDIGGVDVQRDVLGVELQFIVPRCVRVYSPQPPARKRAKKRLLIRYTISR